ncbi:MAG: IPT/TIG domain-containing protein [Actinomycetota bacterium]|nr:IPT/TIG domain-containing protein [Actinomycetota bacterium]
MGRKSITLVIMVACVAMVMGLVVLGCGKKAEPNITSISPSSGEVGTEVTISGTGFGSDQGNGTVEIGSVTSAVSDWSDTKITVKIPSDLKAGKFEVVVRYEDGISNTVEFEVAEKKSDSTQKTPVEVIEKYCQENSIDVSGWEYEVVIVSSSDSTWKIDYGFPPEAEGEGIFFLLQQKSGQWTVVAHTEDAGWTAEQLAALGAPTDLVLGPTPDDRKAAQERAIEDYAKEKGIVIGEVSGGIVYKDSKDSSIDDTWAFFTYQTYEGMGLTFFLLQEAPQGQSWNVVASGGDGFNPQDYGAPSDLTI